MFRYAYARTLSQLIPGAEVVGYDISPFGLHSDQRELTGRVLHIPQGHRHSMQHIASLVSRGVYDHVALDGYFQRLEFYPDRKAMAALFPYRAPVHMDCLGEEYVVIHVRAGDVLGDVHPDYGPVPVSYFEQVVQRTGLQPVIMGQLGDDFYSDAIRRAFSGAAFLPQASPHDDFQVLRSAKNVILGVSSFAWLATWISDRVRTVHLPLKGFLNPSQRPDVDLLPVGDMRYCFYMFEPERWHATPEQQEALLAAHPRLDPVSHQSVRALMSYQAD